MSEFTTLELWNKRYGEKEQVTDYSGRLMKKSACDDEASDYHPVLDHIRPLLFDGEDIEGNIVVCNGKTKKDKDDCYPKWSANGKNFKAVAIPEKDGEYEIVEDD